MTPEEESDYKLRSLAALVLSEMKEKKALPIIIEKLGDAPWPAAYDEQLLLVSAANYGADAVPLIKRKIRKVGKKNAHGRTRLLIVIMNLKDGRAVPELEDMFESDDLDIKSAAARGLRNLGAPVNVSKLLKVLKRVEDNPKGGKDWLETRDRLIDEIGFAGNPEAIPFLKERIEKGFQRSLQRPQCYGEMVALARIGGRDSYLYLRNIYTKSSEYDIKSQVISAFRQARLREAIPFLTDLLDDKSADKQLRLYSADSLREITGDNDKYTEIRSQIIEGQR